MSNVRTLILVPTELERRHIGQQFESTADLAIELCGFGLVAAAARTTLLLHTLRPERVLLLGIAGCYEDRLSIGRAYKFARVSCYGVGVGTGRQYQTAGELGWNHCDSPQIGDHLDLHASAKLAELTNDMTYDDEHFGGELLSCAAASSDREDAETRQLKFPHAQAEDMEGFSVALACKLSNTPLMIVRGISNTAGHRDPAQWKIAEAIQSAIALSRRVLEL